MDKDSAILRQALKRMPAPEPRPEFVERAFAKATGQTSPSRGTLSHLVSRWETWIGAAAGAAVAVVLTLFVLRPANLNPADITLALNETRAIDVLIDSERALDDATIRIVATGSVVLEGFEGEREIDWQTSLAPGNNVLSLPVVARSTGAGELVAVIEHDGRTRRVTVTLNVLDNKASRS